MRDVTTLNTPEPARYDRVSVALHWLIAVLVVASLALAWRFEGLEGAARGELIRLHKSIGATILLLAIFRLGWRRAHPGPPLPTQVGPVTKAAARLVHWSFYGVLVLQPLVGWAMISADAQGRVTRVWSVLRWPPIGALADLPGPAKAAAHHWLAVAHVSLGLLLWVLIAAHVLGALRHRFGDGHKGRMPPW